MQNHAMTKVLLAMFFAIVLIAVNPPSGIAAEANSTEKRELFVTGARLWPVYCAQCHNARPGSQFSPAQWEAITMHMRTVSNMPAKNIRAIKVFLQQAR